MTIPFNQLPAFPPRQGGLKLKRHSIAEIDALIVNKPGAVLLTFPIGSTGINVHPDPLLKLSRININTWEGLVVEIPQLEAGKSSAISFEWHSEYHSQAIQKTIWFHMLAKEERSY